MWKCEKCGNCCRIAGIIFSDLDDGTGKCKHLSENNLCTIYKVRPEICHVKDYFNAARLRQACWIIKQTVENKENLEKFRELIKNIKAR